MSFDLVAPIYDLLSRLVFGRSLERAQLVFLSIVPTNSSILIVGGGTGSLLVEVLTQCQPAHVLFLEASAQMVKLAQQRIQHHALAERVEFRKGTEADLREGEVFGWVMLPFVLDLSREPVLKNRFIPPLLEATAPTGMWLVTDFIHSPKWHHRLVLKTMYTFFGVISGIEARQLPDWQRLLTEAGLTPGTQQLAAGGQVQTGLWHASRR